LAKEAVELKFLTYGWTDFSRYRSNLASIPLSCFWEALNSPPSLIYGVHTSGKTWSTLAFI